MKHSTPSRSASRFAKKAASGFLIALIFSFFAWAANESTSFPLPASDAATEIYASENRDDLRQIILAAIESAQESIFLIVYTLNDKTLIHALKEKARAGVNVRVVVDSAASPLAAKKLGPGVQTLKKGGRGLMHCKILVVDKQFVWLGSANMTTESLKLHSNLVLAMHSPALAEHVIQKEASLNHDGQGQRFAHAKFQIGGQEVELCFLPDDAKYGLEKLKRMIREAEKTIHIAMFTWTRHDLAHEIIRAAKRGVDVQVAIDYCSGNGASAKVVKLLKDNGVSVRLSRGPGLLHHKFMVVDGSTLVNGSANWTKKAFSENDDCFIILSPLTSSQNKALENEWNVLHNDSEAA